MDIVFGVGLLISLLFEGSVAVFPATLAILVVYSLMRNMQAALIAAVISGAVLDIVFLRPVGVTSMVFCLILFLLFLYDRKYEIQSLPFVLLASGVSSLIYLLVFRIPHPIIQSVLASAFSGFIFIISKRFIHKEKKHFAHNL